MGMYTEIFFRGRLKKNTPELVIEILKQLTDGSDRMPPELPEHDFFECSRWTHLMTCSSYYFPEHAQNTMSFDRIAQRWGLAFNADLKDYEGEIDKFFDWINPYVDMQPGEFVGYKLYEEAEAPTLYYKK